ncbi:MAG TPA: ABC transporter substrate-binding protein [Oligoflexia bacterium]|nr:ABC transporter substrate-binding protein [Oligoflexia bacterium]HMP27685.1 ABC transporter substrate-binding protein [Oligoflexia bacterium]
MAKKITIFHSPDVDDAFMFYGLVSGGVNVPGYQFDHDLCDIESLNHRALNGELDVTALSVHAFSGLNGQYAILKSGASMAGQNYGPRLVTKPENKECLQRNSITIAIPGWLTSAALAIQLYLKEKSIKARLAPIFFEKIISAVQTGEFDAGLIIHEGQITHQRDGLVTILDLGEWWWKKHQLLLPLGVNVVHKRLGEEGMQAVGKALKDSIEYSLANRRNALEYAISYGRGLDIQDADTFVGMYVNNMTRDMGETGMASIKHFLKEGFMAGITSTYIEPEFV